MSGFPSFRALQAFQESIDSLDASLEITNREINNTGSSSQRNNVLEFEPMLEATRNQEAIMVSIVNCCLKAKVILAKTKVMHANIELRRRQQELERSMRRLQDINYDLWRSMEDNNQPQQIEPTPMQSHHPNIHNSSAEPIVNSTTSELNSPPVCKKMRNSLTSAQAMEVLQFCSDSEVSEQNHSSNAQSQIQLSLENELPTEEAQFEVNHRLTEQHHLNNMEISSLCKTEMERHQWYTNNLTEPCSSTSVGKENRMPSSSKQANENKSVSHQIKPSLSSDVCKKIKTSILSKKSLKKPYSQDNSNLSDQCCSSKVAKKLKSPSAKKQTIEKVNSVSISTQTEPYPVEVSKIFKLPSAYKQAKENIEPTILTTPTKLCQSESFDKKIKLSCASNQPIKNSQSEPESISIEPCHSSKVDVKVKTPAVSEQSKESTESFKTITTKECCGSETVDKQIQLLSASNESINKQSEPKINQTEPCHTSKVVMKRNQAMKTAKSGSTSADSCHLSKFTKTQMTSATNITTKKPHCDLESNMTEFSPSEVSKTFKLPSAYKQAAENTKSVNGSTPTEFGCFLKCTKRELPFLSKPVLIKPHSNFQCNLTVPFHSSVSKKPKLPSTKKTNVSIQTETGQSENIKKRSNITSKPDAGNTAIKSTAILYNRNSIKKDSHTKRKKTESNDSTSEETEVPFANQVIAEGSCLKYTENAQTIKDQEKTGPKSNKLFGNTIAKQELDCAKPTEHAKSSTASENKDFPAIDEEMTAAPSFKQTTEEIITLITQLQDKTAVADPSLGYHFKKFKNSAKKVKIVPFIPQRHTTASTKVSKKRKTSFSKRNHSIDVAELPQSPKATPFSMPTDNIASSQEMSTETPLGTKNTMTQKILEKSPSVAKNSATPEITEASPPKKPCTEEMFSIQLSSPKIIERLPSPTKEPIVYFWQSLKKVDISSWHKKIGTGKFDRKLQPDVNKTTTLRKRSLSLYKQNNIIDDNHSTKIFKKSDELSTNTNSLNNITVNNSITSPASNSIALSNNDTTLPNNDITIPINDITFPNNDITIPINDITIPINDITIPNKDVTLPNNDITLPNNDITIPNKDVTLPNKDVTLPNNDITLPNNDITIPNKDVTLPNNDITLPNNDITIPNKDVTVRNNNITLTIDDVTLSNDDILQTIYDKTPPNDDDVISPNKIITSPRNITPPKNSITLLNYDDITPLKILKESNNSSNSENSKLSQNTNSNILTLNSSNSYEGTAKDNKTAEDNAKTNKFQNTVTSLNNTFLQSHSIVKETASCSSMNIDGKTSKAAETITVDNIKNIIGNNLFSIDKLLDFLHGSDKQSLSQEVVDFILEKSLDVFPLGKQQ